MATVDKDINEQSKKIDKVKKIVKKRAENLEDKDLVLKNNNIEPFFKLGELFCGPGGLAMGAQMAQKTIC